MTAKVIEHITITTGAARMSPRSEVESAIFPVIKAMMHGATVDGLGFTVETIDGGWRYDIHSRNIPVVRCWLCIDAQASATMWEEANSWNLDERAITQRPRGTPWLAVSILPGMIELAQTSPENIMAIGDLERCIAWTLIETS